MARKYRIEPRGEVPHDLSQRISMLHAGAILQHGQSAHPDNAPAEPPYEEFDEKPRAEEPGQI